MRACEQVLAVCIECAARHFLGNGAPELRMLLSLLEDEDSLLSFLHRNKIIADRVQTEGRSRVTRSRTAYTEPHKHATVYKRGNKREEMVAKALEGACRARRNMKSKKTHLLHHLSFPESDRSFGGFPLGIWVPYSAGKR